VPHNKQTNLDIPQPTLFFLIVVGKTPPVFMAKISGFPSSWIVAAPQFFGFWIVNRLPIFHPAFINDIHISVPTF
jgi:hypothetical protein